MWWRSRYATAQKGPRATSPSQRATSPNGAPSSKRSAPSSSKPLQTPRPRSADAGPPPSRADFSEAYSHQAPRSYRANGNATASTNPRRDLTRPLQERFPPRHRSSEPELRADIGQDDYLNGWQPQLSGPHSQSASSLPRRRAQFEPPTRRGMRSPSPRLDAQKPTGMSSASQQSRKRLGRGATSAREAPGPVEETALALVPVSDIGEAEAAILQRWIPQPLWPESLITPTSAPLPALPEHAEEVSGLMMIADSPRRESPAQRMIADRPARGAPKQRMIAERPRREMPMPRKIADRQAEILSSQGRGRGRGERVLDSFRSEKGGPIAASRTDREAAGLRGLNDTAESTSPSSPRFGITANDWGDQAAFNHLSPLPEGWIRVKSRSSGDIYFCHLPTGETTFTEPGGWVEVTSRSSGRTYYWNAALDKSQFHRPPGFVSSRSGRDASCSSSLDDAETEHHKVVTQQQQSQQDSPVSVFGPSNKEGLFAFAEGEQEGSMDAGTQTGMFVTDQTAPKIADPNRWVEDEESPTHGSTLETPREAVARRKREAADRELARIKDATSKLVASEPIQARSLSAILGRSMPQVKKKVVEPAAVEAVPADVPWAIEVQPQPRSPEIQLRSPRLASPPPPDTFESLLGWGRVQISQSPREAARQRKREASDKSLVELKAVQKESTGTARDVAKELRNSHCRFFLAPFADDSCKNEQVSSRSPRSVAPFAVDGQACQFMN